MLCPGITRKGANLANHNCMALMIEIFFSYFFLDDKKEIGGQNVALNAVNSCLLWIKEFTLWSAPIF